MPSLGDLVVQIGAETAGLDVGAAKSITTLNKLGGVMSDIVKKATAVGAASVAAGVAIALSSVKSVDATSRLANQLNATIGGLRAAQDAAEKYGVSSDELAQSLSVMNARLGEAQRNALAPAAIMLKQLGLNAQELGKLDVDQRVAAIADKVKELGLSSSQTADLLRQFGIRSGELTALLQAGGDQIRQSREEMEQLGLAMSAVDAAKVEAAQRALEDIGDVLDAIKDRIAIGLAPYIQEIATRFTDAAKASGSWQNETDAAIAFVLRGIGKVADVLQGVRVAFKAAEVVGIAFGAGIVSVLQIATEAFVSFRDTGSKVINALIEQLNRIPGVDIAKIDLWTDSAFMQGFRGMADELRDKTVQMEGELHDLAMQELPSDKVEAFLEAVRVRAEAAANATVRAREELKAASQEGLAGFGEDTSKEDERKKKEAERAREQLQAKLDLALEFGKTQTELEIQQHEERQKILDEALAAQLISQADYYEASIMEEAAYNAKIEELRKAHLTDLQKFQEMSSGQQVKTVVGALVNMTAGTARENKRMFEINKAAGIANAIISTYEGVTKALGAYPPPLSFVMAGLQAAAGWAQVSSIKSQTFGNGGGAAPSLAGSTAAPPVSPVANGGGGAGGGQVITVAGLGVGDIFSGKAVRDLIERLQEAQKDGAKVVLA
jgi:hypothetical protein